MIVGVKVALAIMAATTRVPIGKYSPMIMDLHSHLSPVGRSGIAWLRSSSIRSMYSGMQYRYQLFLLMFVVPANYNIGKD